MEKENNKVDMMRHGMAHVLAASVKELYPETKFAIGPVIESGFYYDFDFGDITIGDEELKQIEKKMKHLLKQNIKFERSELGVDEAIEKEKKADSIYKVELIEDLKSEGEKTVSYYKAGIFEDLCRGPHVESTSKLQNMGYKLHKLAGAYWRGDEKNKMLTRIYGLAFETKKELDEHIKLLEEAERRDHRKLGKELDLFMISEEVGKGLPMWLPNGAFIRKKLEDYMYDKEFKAGYSHVYTPVITREELYKQSGHLEHYKDDMYSPIDIEGENYYLKPMNCPHHHIMFRNKPKSYKDLPVRLSDFGIIHRFERSGALTGLIRARCFSQNDAHIYCKRDQIKEEFLKVLQLFKEVYDDFGIEGHWFRLSLPDLNDKEKYGDIENVEMWKESAEVAREAMNEFGAEFVEVEGEAAFYGPKIDVQIKNVMGKEDTIATSQIDFYMPERFNLKYINSEGKEERPVIIHRAIMGSFDRFFSFLIEQYAGAFPVWLSPVQVKVLSVGETHVEFCNKLALELRGEGIRVDVDDNSETVGNKTRKAIGEKIPYILVVGDKEMKSDNLAVRDRGSRDIREISKADFINEIKEKETNKQ